MADSTGNHAAPELTTCYQGMSSCPTDRSGGHGTTQIGLRLVVQQMCSPTSSIVASTTLYPASSDLSFSIPEAVHHSKAHLSVTSGFVTTSPSCPAVKGRSIIVKTLVRHVSGPPLKVEMGCDDRNCEAAVTHSSTRGYSNGFAFANY